MSEPFADYRGRRYLDKVDADQRVALEAWETMLRLGEAGTVDCEHFIETQLYLTAETAGFIYSDYTPTTVRYERGSRPVLEQTLDGLGIRPEMGDFDKFLWMGRFVRDLPDRHNWKNGLPFTGGTEEELIAKGAQMCNEQARLMVALCQVAGLPSRYVGHHIGGHGVTEVYVNGRWSYFDCRGRFFLVDPGSAAAGRGEPTPLASTWEIWQDMSIIRRQPPWVTREVHPHYTRVALRAGLVIRDPYLTAERTFFHPKEGTSITNYFIADREKFNYSHPPEDADYAAKCARCEKARSDVRRKFGMAHGGLYDGFPLPDWVSEDGVVQKAAAKQGR